MAESYSPQQKQWRQALHGILLALGRRMGNGGMLESELVEIMAEELKLPQKITHDALDFLVRDDLIAREKREGVIVSGQEYSLLPMGVVLIAGGGEHRYIRFSNGFLSTDMKSVRSTGGR